MKYRASLRIVPCLVLVAGCGGRSELLGDIAEGSAFDGGGRDGAPVGDSAAPDVDTDSGDDDDVTVTPPCDVWRARVFVTASMYDADLGGVGGADTDCMVMAHDAALGGTWRAWLSDASQPAWTRIYQAPGGYALLDGTVVASSFGALLSGSLSHAIDRTEWGDRVGDGNNEVWTGIDVTSALPDVGYCADGAGNDWASQAKDAPYAIVGHSNATDSRWTAAYLQFCNRTNVRLYCFEVCN